MTDVMQVVASPVTDIAGRLFNCVHTELTYVYYYDRNVASLRKIVVTLTSKRDGILREVHKAEAGMEEIKEEVTTWLNEVQNSIVDNTSWLLRAQRRVEATCSCCTVCFRKRSVSRGAVTRLEEMENLCNRANGFTGAVSAGFRPPPDVEELRCPDYLAELESLQKNREVVMKALAEKCVRLIGIYGLRGVGKTAFVQDINNLLRNRKKNNLSATADDDFSKVIVATVTKKEIITKQDMLSSSHMRDADYQRVQDEIAARLGLKLVEAGNCDIIIRANILMERIQKEKRVLLVLDAVPEGLCLGRLLGVNLNAAPAPSNCKIIVTTWTQDICREMGVDVTVELKRLDREQSWTLFRSVVGDVLAKDKAIMEHGRIIAELCGGLPLAIVTLARSLRGHTTEDVWKEAADCMHNSHAPSMDEMMKVANEALKFSYNHLKGDLIKRCFLFCRMFPRDGKIQLSDLKAYGVGMGFLKVTEQDELGRAYNRLLAFVRRLNSACLLDYAGDDDSLYTAVTMPNAVRSMAMSVIRNEARAFRYFASPGKSIRSWPHQDMSSGPYYVISLMNNSIRELPSTLQSPHLQCLLLQNNPFLEIPNDFFRHALALRVLDMSNTTISSLPKTFKVLKSNLRTLCLNHCRQLSDVALIAVSRLAMLEVLCLRGTNVSELPKEMKNLIKLKLLDISDTTNLKVVPPGVLSALISLEELYMSNSFSSWQVDQEDLQVAPFGDVVSLPRLVLLQVQVEHVDFLSPQLSRFDVDSGEQHPRPKRVPKFCISAEGARPVMNSESKSLDFNNMKKLKVSSCHALKCLLSTPLARSLKLLEELEVEDCGGMEQVIMEETAGEVLDKGTFPRLKSLRLQQLPKLASFCQPEVHLELPWLKNISVVDCPDLRRLPLGLASAPDLKSLRGNRDWFDALKWGDSSVKARIERFLHDG